MIALAVLFTLIWLGGFIFGFGLFMDVLSCPFWVKPAVQMLLLVIAIDCFFGIEKVWVACKKR